MTGQVLGLVVVGACLWVIHTVRRDRAWLAAERLALIEASARLIAAECDKVILDEMLAVCREVDAGLAPRRWVYLIRDGA